MGPECVPSLRSAPGCAHWAALARHTSSCRPDAALRASSWHSALCGGAAQAPLQKPPEALLLPCSTAQPRKGRQLLGPTAPLASSLLLALRSPDVTSRPPRRLTSGDRDAQLGHTCSVPLHRPLPGPPGARGDGDAAEAPPRCPVCRGRSEPALLSGTCAGTLSCRAQSLSSLTPGSSPGRGMPRSSRMTRWTHNPVSRLARPHRHHRSRPAPGPLPASPRAAGTREEPVSLSPSRSPPPSLSPAAPGPAAPGSRRGLAAARGKRALWLPTAARLEEKARISWPGASPSRLLPAAECFGAEGGLFPTGFGPGARGCPCLELLPNVRGSRRQLGSGHFCWQCQNLSTLPINKIPAQAEPLASTEVFPSCSCIVTHNVPRGQWQQGGLVPSHRGFRKDNSPVAKLSPAP